MKAYRFTIKTLSAFGTPPMGDSFLGQMCWAIANLYGQDRLEQLLQGYTEQKPFMVLSDALPSGYLPLPTLPSRFWQKDETMDRKKLKKKQWIAIKETAQPLTSWQLAAVEEKAIHHRKTAERYYNTITRDSLQATPFSNTQLWFEDQTQLDFIVLLDESRFSLAECETVFKQIGLLGFGRDASIGLGRFELANTDVFHYPVPQGANAYLTLANCAPQNLALDATRSYYQITTRFGRHGDNAALSANPFKKPIILAKLGAVFTPNEWKAVAFLGNGLSHISYSQPNAVHQGYAPVIPLVISF